MRLSLFHLSSAVERRTVNALVPGSIPGDGATGVSSTVEQPVKTGGTQVQFLL